MGVDLADFAHSVGFKVVGEEGFGCWAGNEFRDVSVTVVVTVTLTLTVVTVTVTVITVVVVVVVVVYDVVHEVMKVVSVGDW